MSLTQWGFSMKKAKRDPKKQPFAWQEKHILRLIQKSFEGTELSRYLLLYQTLTHIHSDFNGLSVKYFTKVINTYSGLSMRFIPQGIKTFQEFGIVKITGLKEDHTFITKILTFTPENIPEDTESFPVSEINNCNKSTIVEKADLIEHSLRDISKDISRSSEKNLKKSKRKVLSSVRMDKAPDDITTNFLTGPSRGSQIFDRVVSLVTEANSMCTKSPAFTIPQSPETKYLKTLEKQIELLQAGKFVKNYKGTWMPFFLREKFPGQELKGASDNEVWDMIEFSVSKYVRVRNGSKYLFYGNRDAKISLADFMYISYQALRPPEPGVRAPDGYSRFWQYLLPLKQSDNSTFDFNDKLIKLYKKSSSVLGKEVYNNYETLETSEKMRFCKSLIAIGNYYNTHQKVLLKNNAEAVLVIPNLKKLFKFYAKWVKRSGFNHVPGVFPGNDGRWIDFVNWLKKNYGVDLEAIHKPKPKKKKEVYVEPEMSEDEEYERSILGVLYDVLDPDERLHKLKLWFRAQHEEKLRSV